MCKMLIFDINIKVYEIRGKKSLEKKQYVIHLVNFFLIWKLLNLIDMGLIRHGDGYQMTLVMVLVGGIMHMHAASSGKLRSGHLSVVVG